MSSKISDQDKIELIASLALFLMKRNGIEHLTISRAMVDEALSVDWSLELDVTGLTLQTYPEGTYQTLLTTGKRH